MTGVEQALDRLFSDEGADDQSLGAELYWLGVVHLRAWEPEPGLVAFLAVEHQDKELPVVLHAGVRRRAS